MPWPPVTDDFNRANTGPPPSGSWSSAYYGGGGGLKVVGNQLAADVRYSSGWWNAATVQRPAVVYLTHVAVGVPWGLALVQSGVGTATYSGYEFYLDASANITLSRVDSGGYTTIASASVSGYALGSAMMLRVTGTTVEVLHLPSGGSWTSVVSPTDATYAGPYYGAVYMDGDAALTQRMDDFGVGTMAGMPLSPPARRFQHMLVR